MSCKHLVLAFKQLLIVDELSPNIVIGHSHAHHRACITRNIERNANTRIHILNDGAGVCLNKAVIKIRTVNIHRCLIAVLYISYQISDTV